MRVKEDVYCPGRGEDSQHAKLSELVHHVVLLHQQLIYELVVEKDNVVYRLRVNH